MSPAKAAKERKRKERAWFPADLASVSRAVKPSRVDAVELTVLTTGFFFISAFPLFALVFFFLAPLAALA